MNTPEQPEADLFSRGTEAEQKIPVKMYPPDLDVRGSTGYPSRTSSSREEVIRESGNIEVLSPHETYGSVDEDFIPYHKRKWEQKDLQNLVDVIREATKEDEDNK